MANPIVRVSFCNRDNVRLFSATGFAATALDLTPTNLSIRTSSMSANFKKWRLVDLYLTSSVPTNPVPFFNTLSTPTANIQPCSLQHAVCFFGSNSANSSALPSSIIHMSELVQFRAAVAGRDVSLRVNTRSLREARGIPWLLCQSTGTVPACLLSQGVAVVATQLDNGTATTVNGNYQQYLEVRGTIEFCEPTDSTVGVMPLARFNEYAGERFVSARAAGTTTHALPALRGTINVRLPGGDCDEKDELQSAFSHVSISPADQTTVVVEKGASVTAHEVTARPGTQGYVTGLYSELNARAQRLAAELGCSVQAAKRALQMP